MFCDGRSLALILAVMVAMTRSDDIMTQTVWRIKQPLLDYESYSSFFLSSFTVPSLALRSTWLFSAYVVNSKCDVNNAFIGLQYGGFPVLAPLNETFPPFFHLHRSHSVTLTLKTDNSTLNYTVENPVTGNWYAVSALEYDSTKRIKQKDLGLECYFYLDVIHHITSKKEIPSLVVGMEQFLAVEHRQNTLFRFLSGESTYKYSVILSGCNATVCDNTSCSESAPCVVRLTSRSQGIPSLADNDTNVVNCSVANGTSPSFPDCFLEVAQPVVNDWQYVMIEYLRPGNATLGVLILLEGCDWTHVEREIARSSAPVNISESPPSVANVSLAGQSTTRNFTHRNETDLDERITGTFELPEERFKLDDLLVVKTNDEPGESRGGGGSTVNPACLRLSDFGRFSEFLKVFSVVFQRRTGSFPMTNVLQITEGKVVVAGFTVEPLQDSGGTLKLETNFLIKYLNGSFQIVVIRACMCKSRIPFSNGKLSCPSDSPLLEVSNELGKNTSARIYIPYPEYGSWFIGLSVQCYSGNASDGGLRIPEPCRVQGITVNNRILLSPCVDEKCSTDGSCREYYSGILHFTSCYCYYGYRGYGCTDSTYAESNGQQLTSILLLTLSNLFFIPAIIICLYRRFFTEAFVYFFTMFFSSFYHACDGENRYTICIMPYSVLSYCDFLGAIVSFWVTIVTMARLPPQWTSFSYVVAILALAMGVSWDKQSLWTFLVPCVVAGVILILSWALRCRRLRSCYPSRKRWLLLILPGICLALLGLIIFAGFETEDNYQYTHSAWHTCIALCIVFLLPSRSERNAVDELLWNVNVNVPDDVALVDYSTPKEVIIPSDSDDPRVPENSAAREVDHQDVALTKVPEDDIQKLVKNGFV